MTDVTELIRRIVENYDQEAIRQFPQDIKWSREVISGLNQLWDQRDHPDALACIVLFNTLLEEHPYHTDRELDVHRWNHGIILHPFIRHIRWNDNPRDFGLEPPWGLDTRLEVIRLAPFENEEGFLRWNVTWSLEQRLWNNPAFACIWGGRCLGYLYRLAELGVRTAEYHSTLTERLNAVLEDRERCLRHCERVLRSGDQDARYSIQLNRDWIAEILNIMEQFNELLLVEHLRQAMQMVEDRLRFCERQLADNAIEEARGAIESNGARRAGIQNLLEQIHGH